MVVKRVFNFTTNSLRKKFSPAPIRHIKLNVLHFLIALCGFAACQANTSSANFIFDDFDLGQPPDVSMVNFRYVNDELGERNYTMDNFDGPGLILFPRFFDNAAELFYDQPVGFDFAGVNRFTFQVAASSSNYAADLKITTINDGTQSLGTGVIGTDAFGFDTLTFDLNTPIQSSDLLRLSFDFSADDGVSPWSFGSTQLTYSSSIQPVPEPTSILLVSAAFACGAGCYSMRKRREPKV